MRFLITVLLCCCLSTSFAQKIKVQDGWLIANDSFYCRYEENSNVANKQFPDPQKRNFAVWETDEFYDFTLSTVDSLPCIVAKAMTLAAVDKAYLSFYYAVRFPFLDKEIDIQSQPYFRENFLKDVVKYHVFTEGIYSEDAAMQLYNKWQHKMGIIPTSVLANSVSAYYNKQQSGPSTTEIDKIRIKGNAFYKNDSLIGSFKPSQEIRKTGRYFTIYNTRSKYVANLWIADTRVQAYLKIGDNKEEMALVSANKSDEFLLKRVAALLLKLNLL
ncbi:MAG: hypothetical protein JSS96_04545 [Bacteroidetes bacterium]|nr:hypothetical protein [Bacteroidota bacterium]